MGKSSDSENDSIDIIDIGELSWSDRIRRKPKIQGKYMRGDLLGQGTFAKVYEVLDIKTLQRRAVKVFDLHKLDRKFNRDEMISMVNQEIKLLARCHHKNIIKMVDVYRSFPVGHHVSETCSIKSKLSSENEITSTSSSDTEKSSSKQSNSESVTSKLSLNSESDSLRSLVGHKSSHLKNKIWMYLEYCMASVSELMNLSDPAHCAILPRHQVRHYFKGLIKGLNYLHSIGIFHKDIKPDNMLVDVWDTIKLTDLSVSHVVDLFDTTDTCVNTYGTISYQSPEVINSPESGYSAAALDIWSSGVSLYVMVTGKTPFAVNNLIDMIESISKDEPAKAPVLEIDPCLANLIQSMLNKDPTKRIKLPQIFKHPWLRVNLPRDEPSVQIPPRYANGDQYRSLTITSHLHELHYPLPSQYNVVTVSETSADEFNAKRKIPIVRSNRSPKRKKPKKKQTSLLVKQFVAGGTNRLLGAMGLQVVSLLSSSASSSSHSDSSKN